MRFLTLAWTHLRIGILNELQYRVNFFIQLLQSLIALGIGWIGLALVFDHTANLNGWTRPELLAVMGVQILMGGVIRSAIQPNMQRLMTDIQEGTLDYVLTKPVDAQLIISVREFRLWQLVDVVMGLVILGVALAQMSQRPSAGPAVMFVVALFIGAVLFYCFWLLITTISFWVIRIGALENLFEGLYAAGRWPVGIYPDWLRGLLTYLIPVAFAITIPAEALTGRLNPPTLLGAGLLAVALALVTRFFWRLGLRNYAGASA